MRTKIILGIVITGLIIIAMFNSNLMPLRREISDMEIILIAGLDKVGDEYMITFIKRNESDSSKGDAQDSSAGSQVISMTADSYTVALRQLQTTTDKFTTASHIKYYIIGEQTLRDDFVHITDAIARGYQTRLNSKIYMAKGMTAREFLTKASKLEFNIENKLENMESSFWEKSNYVHTDILDFGHISFSETGDGLIDTLEFYNTADEEQKDNMESSTGGKENETSDKISFGFGGAAIVNNCKVDSFLTKDETTIANYILNTDNVNVITINDKDDFVVFRIEQLSANVNFEFDNKNKLNGIKIDVSFKANYEETNASVPIFTENMIEYFEKELNAKVEEQIKEIINIEQEKGIDFLYLKEKLELTHPYKNIEDKNEFMELIKNCKVSVVSKGGIQTTYDIVESNKRQEGESK